MKKITKFACMLLVMGGGLIGLNSCGDDDEIPVVQNPAAPTGLSYESVTDVSAVLTWAGEATTYEVAVGNAAAVVVTGKSYTASGLTPETQYTWKVRAKDGDLYSDWVNGNPFTTTAPASSFVDKLIGTWDVTEFYIKENAAYDNSHVITIEKIDGATIKISNFSDANYGNTGAQIGDEVVATVDAANKTITIAYQELTPTWNPSYSTYFAPMTSGTFCNNIGESMTQTVIETGTSLAVSFNGPLTGNIDGEPYVATYVVLGLDSSSACAGGFLYFMGTVWRKQSGSPSPAAAVNNHPVLPKRPSVVNMEPGYYSILE